MAGTSLATTEEKVINDSGVTPPESFKPPAGGVSRSNGSGIAPDA